MTEPRRIRPPAEYDGKDRLIEKLMEPNGPFESKQAVMMFAAAVGYRLGLRDISSKFGEGIRWEVFEKNQDDGYVNALALAVQESIKVLAPENDEQQDKVSIFEEYAAGGLKHLENQVLRAPEDILDQCLRMVAEARRATQSASQALSGLSADDLEFLGGARG